MALLLPLAGRFYSISFLQGTLGWFCSWSDGLLLVFNENMYIYPGYWNTVSNLLEYKQVIGNFSGHHETAKVSIQCYDLGQVAKLSYVVMYIQTHLSYSIWCLVATFWGMNNQVLILGFGSCL